MASRSIDVAKSALKFLERLADKQRNQILTRIAGLRDSPVPHDAQLLRKVLPPTHRIDVGEYRVIYRYDDDMIFVLLVGKRNDDDVYRKFQRKQK